MNLLVFDIETVPDVEGGRRIYDLGEASDTDTAEILFHYRRQQTEGRSDFLRHYLHRVVAIAVIERCDQDLRLHSLGAADSPEQELIAHFFELVAARRPVLVSWNGRRFDQPVLHYRALLHGIDCAAYWDRGERDREFRWNNYLNRYHLRHVDLADVLSSYDVQATAPLHEISRLLGLPGKSGMNGSEVWQHYQDGGIADIRNYCETDVLNTYLLYLRYSRMQGSLDTGAYRAEVRRVQRLLSDSTEPHLSAYLEAWRDSSRTAS